MKLTLGTLGEREIANEAELREALALLDGGDDSFAILSIDDDNFIQATGGNIEGFMVERRLDAAERLDHAMRADGAVSPAGTGDHGIFDLEETTQLFLAILHRRPNPIFVHWDARGVEVGSSGCAPLVALIAAPTFLLLTSSMTVS